jgi:hypothetical protein
MALPKQREIAAPLWQCGNAAGRGAPAPQGCDRHHSAGS